MLYVGIDVSKLKLDCSLSQDGDSILSRKVVSNNEAGFQELRCWVNRYCQKLGTNIHIGMESTGIYSEAAFYFFHQAGISVSILNPSQVKHFGKSLLLRTKTDKIDADMIVCYTARMKPRVSQPAPQELRKLRKYVHHLDFLTRRCAETKGRKESCREPEILASMEEIILGFEAQISETKKHIRLLLNEYSWLKSKALLLQSIPGIGEQTAWALIAELLDITDNQKISRKHQVAHSGLAPAARVSGSSVRGQSRICGKGNDLLRKCLYMPTISSLQHNPQIQLFYKRLLENGKRKKVAVTACMKKLLCIAIGVLNNEIPFDENWKSIKPNYT